MKVFTAISLLFCIAACSAGRIDSFAKSVQEAQENLNGKIWAVLVAGSNGYYNYRHQSDVYHAYQVLKAHGIPDAQIVVFHYDDIANHRSNPTPGVVINQPGGKDVYAGVPKDFTGRDVTPKNFLKALAGNQELKKNGKKVVESGKDDHVFIFFSDHGAEGLIAFPNGELYAKDLNNALVNLHKENRFRRLVFYVEACNAGSMFHKLLPADINIYAVTASNERESSYATYWDAERGAFLGDEFSVNWLENSDAHPDLSKWTLQQQFDAVQKKTEQSHVTRYGDVSIATLPVSEFQGSKVAVNSENRFQKTVAHELVPSEDVPLITAARLAAASPEKEHLQAVHEGLLSGRKFVDGSRHLLGQKLVQKLGFPESILTEKFPLIEHDCYKTLVKAFDKHCFDLSTHPYALRSLHLLVNVCETLDQASKPLFGAASVAQFLETECKQHVQNHPFASVL